MTVNKDTDKGTVVVAMSGGVDSSVAAVLLHEQGYNVIGATMKLWDFEEVGGNINHESGCCSLESFNDAREICVNLGIPHYVMNFSHEFHQDVVEDFIDEYLSGRTPNPCVQCNTKIKWKTLLEKAEELGADFIATGHYARSRYNEETDRFELLCAIDRQKDQSYALWGIRQSSLAKTLFPLGEMRKSEVRKLARSFGLSTAEKKESQEICFVVDNNYRRLLRQYDPKINERLGEGKLIDTDGKVVGTHDGYPFYTIGQRRGLGGGYAEAMYVVDINAESNLITIGEESALYDQSFIVENTNFICIEDPAEPLHASIKIRYNDKGHPGCLYPMQNGMVKVKFDTPQKAVTAGQSAVFFDGNRVLGGGIIKEKKSE
jgi:tRNA-specific 2-thiouridylase